MGAKIHKLEGLGAMLSETPVAPEDLSIDLPAGELDQLKLLEQAGWRLQAEDDANPEQRRVYKDEAGHVLIEGQYLTFGTKPGVSVEEAETIASEYGLAIHRTLGLRRNQFQVKPVNFGTERPDPVDICLKLEADDRVTWADPSLIEAIGRRSSAEPEGE